MAIAPVGLVAKVVGPIGYGRQGDNGEREVPVP